MTLTYAAQRVAMWCLEHDPDEIPDQVCVPGVAVAVFEELDRAGYAEHVKSLGGSSLLLTAAGRGVITQQAGMIRANIVQRLLLDFIAAHNDVAFEPPAFISSTAGEFTGQAAVEEVHDAAAVLHEYGLICDVSVDEVAGPLRPSLSARGRVALRSPYAPSEMPARAAVGASYTQNNQFATGGAATQGDNNAVTINQTNISEGLAQFEAGIQQMRDLIEQLAPSQADFAGNQLDHVTEQAREGAGRDALRGALTALSSGFGGALAVQLTQIAETALHSLT